MRDIMQILGKRLVSDKQMIAYHRFPLSDEVTLIPPGQPSPVIDSYIQRDSSGYFQLKGNGENLYVWDGPSVKVVDPGASDESSVYDRFNSAIGGLFYNTQKDVEAQAGYLSEGAKKTFDELQVNLFDVGKYIKQIALVAVVIIGLLIISKF